MISAQAVTNARPLWFGGRAAPTRGSSVEP